MAKRNKKNRQMSQTALAVHEPIQVNINSERVVSTHKVQRRNRSVLKRQYGSKNRQTGDGGDPSWSAGIKKLMGRVQHLRGEPQYLEHPGDFRPNQPPNYTPAHLQDIRAGQFSAQSFD